MRTLESEPFVALLRAHLSAKKSARRKDHFLPVLSILPRTDDPLSSLPAFPLTLFEKYFLLDTSEDFPMLVDGVFHFTGCFEPEKFETALHEALQRQPLFTRKIEKRNGKYYWVPSNEPLVIQWLEAPPDWNGKAWNEPIDIFRRNGLDVYVVHQGDETKIYYRCHHICTDGIGFYRFFLDVFVLYAQKCGVGIDVPVPVVSERILDRDRMEPGELPEKIGVFRIVFDTVKEIVRWLREKPIFVGRRAESENSNAQICRKTYTVAEETLDRCRAMAREANCTLNDLLTAAFFVLLEQRCQDANADRSNRGNRIRLMIPINMRQPGCETIPATNMISYVFLTKKPSECRADRNFLLGISNEMRIIKDWQVGYMFWDALRFFDWIPGGLRLMTGTKRCRAGMVFSNMGVVERYFGETFSTSGSGIVEIAGMRLDRVESFAPCRPLTNLSVAAHRQAGKLLLSCEYNRTYLSEAELDQMFNDYETVLRRFSRNENDE